MYDKTGIKYVLAENIHDVQRFLQQESPDEFFCLDSEASRLDTRLAKLAGISICINPTSAMYCPVGHKLGKNLPAREVTACIQEKMDRDKLKPAFYNTKYDLNVIQANTGWDPGRGNHLDVLELVYLENPDRMLKDLKTVSREDLGYEMQVFGSLFTPEEVKSGAANITTKRPEQVLTYACDDVIALRLLLTQKKHILTEFNFAVQVDTKIVDIIRRLEHNGGMTINTAYVDQQLDLLEKRATALASQVHRIVGYSFEINSPKALGIALFEKLGLPVSGKTKTGQYKTDAETLEQLAGSYPVAEYVVTFRKLVKARGTYFAKLKRLAETKKPVRFGFHIYAAPTFRFAAPGGDPDVDGMTGVNIQAVSNGEQRDMPAVSLGSMRQEDVYLKDLDADELLIDLKSEGITDVGVLPSTKVELLKEPWVVSSVDGSPYCIRETCKGCLQGCEGRGVDVIRRHTKNLRMIPSVRQAFSAPEGYTMCSFDYDRQELVIGANLSGEQNWIRALLNKEDLHIKSAVGAFGLSPEMWERLPKEEKKDKRDVGKIINFAIFYGATAYTISRKANISPAQGEQVFDNYRRANPQLFSWMAKVHMFARKNGYTTTYFGRRRWLKQFYEEAAALIAKGGFDRKKGYQLQAFADRSAVNTAIQGTGAEVTRIAMVKVDKKLSTAGYTRREVFLAMQLHDELSYCIKDELVPEVAAKVQEAMEFNVKAWPVQLSVGYKKGKVWGVQEEVPRLAA